ncbi:MAG: hypothetical protein G01um10148_247 [Parcubacteria group bacterium Gr01-1014_8]|nr:MAG: hypothetical protein G01um10148_247 [Parcubacteria group bacterium Gr01-1014_8]
MAERLTLREELAQRHPVLLKDWLRNEGVPIGDDFSCEMEFNLGRHSLRKDARRFREYSKEADIIFSERLDWTPLQTDVYQQVSAGTLDAVGAGKTITSDYSKFQQGELEQIFETGASIYHLDLPLGEESVALQKDIIDKIMEHILLHEPPLSLEEAQKTFLNNLDKDATLHTAREEHAAAEFRSLVKKALTERPELLNRKPLRILVIYGLAHTSLKHRITTTYPDVLARPSTEYSTSYREEYLQNRLWGIEPTEELEKKVFFEAWAASSVPKRLLSVSQDAARIWGRNVVDALSIQEWQRMYGSWMEGSDRGGVTKFIKHKLKEAGVPDSHTGAMKLKKWYKQQTDKK